MWLLLEFYEPLQILLERKYIKNEKKNVLSAGIFVKPFIDFIIPIYPTIRRVVVG